MTDLKTKIIITADAVQMVNAAGKVINEFQRIGSEGTKAGKNLDSSFSATRRGIVSISDQLKTLKHEVIGFFSARFAFNLGRDIFNTAADMESLGNAMKAVTGSSAAAAKELKFVRGEADRLGLPLMESTRQFVALTAAARGTKLEGKATHDIFTALTEASTVLGLSNEQLGGALTAVQQMMSKGTVAAEELRGQLGERLYGAFQIAASSVGLTTQQFEKLMATGQLAADKFLPALAWQLRHEFGDGVAEASKSARAELSRFENTVTDLKLEFARSGFMDSLVEGFKRLNELLKDPEVKANVRELSSFISQVIELAVKYADKLDNLAGALVGLRLGKNFGPWGAAAGATVGAIAPELLGGAGESGTGGKAATPPAIDARIKNLERQIASLRAGLPLAGDRERGRLEAALQEKEAQLSALKQQMRATASPGGGGKPEPIDLAAAARAKQIADAREELEKLTGNLQQQIATLGMGREAVAEYRVTLGDLANDIKLMGPEGEQWRASVLDQANALHALETQTRAAEEAEKARQQLAEDGRQLTESLRTDYETLTAEIEKYRGLLNAGVIDQETFNRAVNEAGKKFSEAGEKAGGMSQFAIQAARNMQSAFADFLFDPFDKGLGGMLQSFAQTLRRMAAEIAASQLLKAFFSGIGHPELAAAVHHSGGVAGSVAPTRRISPLAFIGAPRYHTGGIAGLAPDEVPAILQRGETVIPRGGVVAPVKVEVINNTGAAVRTEESQVGGQSVTRVIIGEVAADIRRGGDVSRALQQSFGLMRPGVARG